MTPNKALRMALKIIDICRKSKAHSEIASCGKCPFFSANGCIVTDGNNIPEDWLAADIVEDLNIRKTE